RRAVSKGGVEGRCRRAVSKGGVEGRCRRAVSKGGVEGRCRSKSKYACATRVLSLISLPYHNEKCCIMKHRMNLTKY
ncbi:hypothetical protein, partial [Sphaerospermopsis sp. LEGE 00249]|uniref:hypothetical protein n=1 Tax=Sphaerospermopsis sp. LEGE 00249 TaxID=1380707 RepID=UPI001C9B02A5